MNELIQVHVFLGPTLHESTAQKYLPHACYHPPIQCGDIIRLLRLNPTHIVIIDGLYEQVPAVWHKEILLALDKGIAVYGAASMGALRAAEMHQYGMVGIGTIFHAFASNQLNDDDEVAVLHYDLNQQLHAINDAMVNIRATLDQAVQQHIIQEPFKTVLIEWCKAQFYASRSLQQAINLHQLHYPKESACLQAWLDLHGMIDVKQQDAIAVLQHVQQVLNDNTKPLEKNDVVSMPYTKFIASLIDDEITSLFEHQKHWLPEQEQQLAAFAESNTQDYNLIVELAHLFKNAYAIIDQTELLPDHQSYLNYIKQHKLYFPESLYRFIKAHPMLSPLYPWMLHYSCLGNISNQRIVQNLPAFALYFSCDRTEQNQELLSWILFFILLLHQQIDDKNLNIKQQVWIDHLREIHLWERYKQHKKHCLEQHKSDQIIDKKQLIDIAMIYMTVIYLHHGLKDVQLGQAKAPSYFRWLYDAAQLHGCH